LSAFYDFGTVFENVDAYDVNDLRTSLGVSFNWRSPIGPLSFSYAEALNPQQGDETEKFQFTIGTLF
jgi:outer membrane protein insertion porin family